MIEPTTKEETLTILQNLKAQYEEFHHVTFSPEALKACVELSERYISSRFFQIKLSMSWMKLAVVPFCK